MIDEIKIESDERGFELVITGDFVTACQAYLADDDAHSIHFRLPQDAAIQLLAQTRSEIGPWAEEREAAWSSFKAQALATDDWSDADAYDLADPKHPTFVERFADAADLGRKRGKGE